MKEEIVEILEPAKGGNRIIKIPLKNVPQGYVQVRFNGTLYWMSPDHISPGGIKHEPFVGDLRRKIIKLTNQLQEVLPRSYEEWEETLRKETDPDKEINSLFHISNLYKSFSVKYKDINKKKELIKLLFECSSSTKKKMLKTNKPILLTPQEASRIIKRFYA